MENNIDESYLTFIAYRYGKYQEKNQTKMDFNTYYDMYLFFRFIFTNYNQDNKSDSLGEFIDNLEWESYHERYKENSK